jgi:hypothetical protein
MKIYKIWLLIVLLGAASTAVSVDTNPKAEKKHHSKEFLTLMDLIEELSKKQVQKDIIKGKENFFAELNTGDSIGVTKFETNGETKYVASHVDYFNQTNTFYEGDEAIEIYNLLKEIYEGNIPNKKTN